MRHLYNAQSALVRVIPGLIRPRGVIISRKDGGLSPGRHLAAFCATCALASATLLGAPSAIAGIETSAAEAFREYCYDPVRSERRLKQPDLSQGWALAEVDPESGPAFLKGFEGDIYIKTQAAGDTQLLMIQDPAAGDETVAGTKLLHASCRLVHLGDVEEDALVAHLEETVFPLDGYRLESGHRMSLRLPKGWAEWCWSVMPRRDMSGWKLEEHNNHPGQSACIYITNNRQYNFTDLVTIRIAEKSGESGILLLQLDRTFKPYTTD